MAGTAIIIVGPESSGTRFLTRLFVSAGCYGDSWHKQRLDNDIPDVRTLVYRRSYPHAGQWPDLGEIAQRFVAKGYKVKVIVIVRSQQFCESSRQRKEAFKKGAAEIAMKKIFSQIADHNLSFIWVTYEAILLYKLEALKFIFAWTGTPLPPSEAIKIKDGNKKYVRRK